MAFLVSPGVQVKEIDLTNVIPAVSTSIGGFAGAFNWGPVEEIRTIGSEKELAAVFGTPDNETAVYFLTAASFLTYTNALKVVRAETAGMLNATTGASGLLVKNRDHLDDVTTTSYEFIAKYPGTLGNSLKVSVCPVGDTGTGDTIFEIWAYADQFDAAPGTSDFASDRSCSNDELHIAVIDEDGSWSGVPGTVLETFPFVSQASDAKSPQGTSNYYVDVINGTSAYIWAGDAPTALPEAGNSTADVAGDYNAAVTVTAAIDESLAGGADDNTPTVGEIQLGYDLFEDAETVDVNLLFAVPGANGGDDVTLANDLLSIATARKDVVAFISPPIEDTVGTATPAADVKAFADQLTSTSYGVIDSTAIKVYDKYNDVYRWIPASGHMAGLCANTDQVADAWFSPAGFTRGQILGITKIAFNPKQADRDTLYKARINPIVSFPGQGTVLYGDKTAQAKPSAFDRINVRRLFITLEKAIATAAKFQLFEFNDEFTRAMFRNMVEPFLRDVKGRRGITDFAVVCDATNNTGEVVDTNRFVADIYIKPARSINFITLNFIATRTGVEFSEIIGQ
jgi:phage tail sheath protein FI